MQQHIVDKCLNLLKKFGEAGKDTIDLKSIVNSFSSAKRVEVQEIIVELVDHPEVAATCDPSEVLKGGLLTSYKVVNASLPASRIDVGRHKVKRSHYHEYVKLVARQLQVGKSKLCQKPKGVGSFFTLKKGNGVTLRPIWHEGKISEAAAAPPTPPPDWAVQLRYL